MEKLEFIKTIYAIVCVCFIASVGSTIVSHHAKNERTQDVFVAIGTASICSLLFSAICLFTYIFYILGVLG